MKCKFCQAELESNSSVCPSCGKDNLKDDLKGLKILALSLVCVVMLVLLAGLVNYGATGSFLPQWGAGDNTDPTKPTGGNTVKDNKVTILTADGEVTIEKEELAGYMDDVVVTMGEDTMTNGQLQLFYWMAAYNQEKLDTSKSLHEQVYDEKTGQTWHDYLLSEAVLSWREWTLMRNEAEKADFKLDEETEKYLAGMEKELEGYVQMYQMYGYDVKDVDGLIKLMYGPGTDFKMYYDYMYGTYYGGMYWSEMMEDMEVTDQQIEDYFKENEESLAKDYNIPVTKDFGNLSDVRNIMIKLITKKDEDGKTVADWDATKAKAQEIYDKWVQAGKTEEAFIELVTEFSADENSKKNDGLYADMFQGSMAEVDVRHILFFPAGATASNVTSKEWPEEAWAAAQKEAQEVLDAWLAGEKTEESFGALANKHSDDNGGKVTNGGIYTDVYTGQMVKAFNDWCFDPSRQSGDTGIVKTEYGYHVMYFIRSDNAADNWVSDEKRQNGDVEILATDKGYQILFFLDSEPAWIRYSRYGAQAEIVEDMLEQLKSDAKFHLAGEAVVIALQQ